MDTEGTAFIVHDGAPSNKSSLSGQNFTSLVQPNAQRQQYLRRATVVTSSMLRSTSGRMTDPHTNILRSGKYLLTTLAATLYIQVL